MFPYHFIVRPRSADTVFTEDELTSLPVPYLADQLRRIVRALDVITRCAFFVPCEISRHLSTGEISSAKKRASAGSVPRRILNTGPRTIVSRTHVTHVIPSYCRCSSHFSLSFSEENRSIHARLYPRDRCVRAYVIPRAIVPMHLFVTSHLVASSTRETSGELLEKGEGNDAKPQIEKNINYINKHARNEIYFNLFDLFNLQDYLIYLFGP